MSRTKKPIVSEEKREWLKNIRDLCNLIEKSPDLGVPYTGTIVMQIGKDQVAATAKALGSFTKEFTEDSLHMNKMFGDIKLMCFTSRDAVCRKVLSGTKIVTKLIVDPSFIQADTPMVEVTEEVPVYEYICPPSLLNFNPEYEVEA